MERRRHLRCQGGITIAVAKHVMTQHDVGELRRQPRQCDPGFEEALLLRLVETIEMIGDPKRVEMRQRFGKDVLLLEHHDRLIIAPLMTGNRRQPAKFCHEHNPFRTAPSTLPNARSRTSSPQPCHVSGSPTIASTIESKRRGRPRSAHRTRGCLTANHRQRSRRSGVRVGKPPGLTDGTCGSPSPCRLPTTSATEGFQR